MKEYVFTGTWSYICYANSRTEAIEKFSNSSIDEVDHHFDFHNIEEIGEDEE